MCLRDNASGYERCLEIRRWSSVGSAVNVVAGSLNGQVDSMISICVILRCKSELALIKCGNSETQVCHICVVLAGSYSVAWVTGQIVFGRCSAQGETSRLPFKRRY